jgi:hypothetical protein
MVARRLTDTPDRSGGRRTAASRQHIFLLGALGAGAVDRVLREHERGPTCRPIFSERLGNDQVLPKSRRIEREPVDTAAGMLKKGTISATRLQSITSSARASTTTSIRPTGGEVGQRLACAPRCGPTAGLRLHDL